MSRDAKRSAFGAPEESAPLRVAANRSCRIPLALIHPRFALARQPQWICQERSLTFRTQSMLKPAVNPILQIVSRHPFHLLQKRRHRIAGVQARLSFTTHGRQRWIGKYIDPHDEALMDRN